MIFVGVIIVLIIGVVGYLAIQYVDVRSVPSSKSTTTSTSVPTSTQIQNISSTFEAEAVLYTAKEGGIHDGDTIYISVPLIRINPDVQAEVSDLLQKKYISVRFARIDAPELENTGGYETTDFLRQLMAGSDNRVYLDLDNYSDPPFRDVYDRLLGVVYVYIDNKPINVAAEVLRWGAANGFNLVWEYADEVPSEFDYNEWLNPSYPYVR